MLLHFALELHLYHIKEHQKQNRLPSLLQEKGVGCTLHWSCTSTASCNTRRSRTVIFVSPTCCKTACRTAPVLPGQSLFLLDEVCQNGIFKAQTNLSALSGTPKLLHAKLSLMDQWFNCGLLEVADLKFVIYQRKHRQPYQGWSHSILTKQ
eukprot:1086-Pelagomonas_calceolata.AAC.2